MLHVSSLWCYRAITWVILGCAFAFALVILLVRFWVLPHMGDYREPIAKQLSEATRQKVTIGKLDGRLFFPEFPDAQKFHESLRMAADYTNERERG